MNTFVNPSLVSLPPLSHTRTFSVRCCARGEGENSQWLRQTVPCPDGTNREYYWRLFLNYRNNVTSVTRGKVQGAWRAFSRETYFSQWFSSLCLKPARTKLFPHRKKKIHFRTQVAVSKLVFIFGKHTMPHLLSLLIALLLLPSHPSSKGLPFEHLNMAVLAPLTSLLQLKCFQFLPLFLIWNWFEQLHHPGQWSVSWTYIPKCIV